MNRSKRAERRPGRAAEHLLSVRTATLTTARLRPLYSRYVGAMKILLPLTAVALIGLIVGWPDGSPDSAGFRLSFANVTSGESGSLGMSKARYIGTDENGQPFVITADTVTPDDADPNRFWLQTLQADITFDDGSWFSLMAPSGVYDRDSQLLKLPEEVDIFSDQGFELHTTAARVDLASSVAEGDQPVQASGPLGILQANGFRLSQSDGRLIFTGGVQLTARPAAR